MKFARRASISAAKYQATAKYNQLECGRNLNGKISELATVLPGARINEHKQY